MKRFWRLLRSRKLAVWAIIAFVVYAAVATTVSDGNWAVPYHNPIFLVLAAFLTASTAACAWERTRVALSNARLKPSAPATIERLRTRPALTVAVPTGVDAIAAAEDALHGLRMRVLRIDDSLEARAGIAGAFGSPVFHWALALLFVVIALGQLTRAEGLMGVVSGSSKPDVAASYGNLETGPFVGSLTGRVIAVPSIESTYTANGVEQGITPYVEIRSADGAEVLAGGYAYANHPIRYRSMLVHASGDGLAAVVEVADQQGDFTQEILLDYNEDRTAVVPALIGIAGTDGKTIATVLINPGEESATDVPLVRVRAAAGDASADMAAEVDVVVHEGEEVDIPGGLTLKVVKLTMYARLSVVDDWSVYYIYMLFVLAAIGLTLAVFAPLRGARVLLVADEEGTRLHVAIRHGRGDPHFPARVEAALRAALESGEESA